MHDKDTFAKLDSLFDEVLEMPVDERECFINRVKIEHPDLAEHLGRLLGMADAADCFLDHQAEEARNQLLMQSLARLRSSDLQYELQTNDQLGQYRIERTIGRGVYATVYLATRKDADWNQQVAIKLMARGVSSDDVLRRFYAERQILTELRYAGICTLLDGGVADDGLPYFVMEYIDGVSITEFCRNRSLGLRDRIHLFQQVCEAVANAHRHLVVHRDIKPGNILVSRNSRVKLLDFGIAKLLEPNFPGTAAITQMEARPMTPAFASPEQMAGEPITTATDVYQLGLLLAAILTGVEEPLKSLGITGGSRPKHELGWVAEKDGAGLPYRAKALRGDLEWIVLKCLEPEPVNRYGSAAELSAELVRFLEDRPVLARRATFPYQAGKFIRRRPGLAISGAVVLIATVVFVVMISYFNVNLARERTAALDAATRAEEVKNLLVRLLSSADPYRGSGADTRVSDLLTDSEQILYEDIGHRPELQEELFGTLADVYSGLSMPEESARVRQHQLDLLINLRGPTSFEVLQARRKLALSRSIDEKIEITVESLQSILADLIQRHPNEWLERAKINRDIGNLLHVYGKDSDAAPYVNHSVTILRQKANSPEEMASSLLLLGTVTGIDEETLVHHREAAEILANVRGPEHPSTLNASVSVASTLSDLGRYQESLEMFDLVIPIMERKLGPLHVQTLTALNNRAVCLSRMGDNEAAINGFREVLERDRQVHGSEHRDIADRLQNLGAMLNRMGRYDEAIEALTEAARIYRNVNLPGNPATAFPHITLADINGKLGSISLLEFHARKALELLQGNVPDNHHAILKSTCLLGDALIRKGLRSEGVAIVDGALEILEGQEVVNQRLIDECSALLTLKP